jgi:hypothetical protein
MPFEQHVEDDHRLLPVPGLRVLQIGIDNPEDLGEPRTLPALPLRSVDGKLAVAGPLTSRVGSSLSDPRHSRSVGQKTLKNSADFA